MFGFRKTGLEFVFVFLTSLNLSVCKWLKKGEMGTGRIWFLVELKDLFAHKGILVLNKHIRPWKHLD